MSITSIWFPHLLNMAFPYVWVHHVLVALLSILNIFNLKQRCNWKSSHGTLWYFMWEDIMVVEEQRPHSVNTRVVLVGKEGHSLNGDARFFHSCGLLAQLQHNEQPWFWEWGWKISSIFFFSVSMWKKSKNSFWKTQEDCILAENEWVGSAVMYY